MIRFILVCIVVIGYLILSIPILLVEWIIGRFLLKRRISAPLGSSRQYSDLSLRHRCKDYCDRRRKCAKGHTCTLYRQPQKLLRHTSYLLPLSDPYRLHCQKEMEKIPLLSTWMRYLHCLFLDRKDIKQGLKTILTAVDKVKSGISICIFPEGTRNRNKDELDMLPFHEGASKSLPSQLPDHPIAISNSANIFEAHFPKISPAKVVVEYGKPIYPDELSKEDKRHVGEYTQNVIREMLIKNKPLTEK